jgi:1-acyl-sn-glycerol-3-phosphate acyltransferase
MLQAGISVTVFPQSTRSPYLDVEEMNTLGAKLAGMAGVPMVPLALATDFQGNGRLFKDFGRIDCRRPIRFEFGPPVPVEGHGREAHERVVAFIAERLKAWGVPVRQRST